MYDVHSSKAEEFINHEEILATLQYAEENKENRPLLDAILEKAKTRVGLNHREAMVLLECPLPEYKEKLFALAKEIKQAIYGNRIICSFVFIKLLYQWLCLLPIPCKK